jgi:hypothetical protein
MKKQFSHLDLCFLTSSVADDSHSAFFVNITHVLIMVFSDKCLNFLVIINIQCTYLAVKLPVTLALMSLGLILVSYATCKGLAASI